MPIRSERLDIGFDSGGTTYRGWLYLPDSSAPPPVIVMAHGLGAVKELRLDAFAERFCAAGYACLVFDYRHFGASDGTPRQLIDIDTQLADWAAAVAYARTRPELNGMGLREKYYFDIYVGGGFERAVRDQLEFLARHVPTSA